MPLNKSSCQPWVSLNVHLKVKITRSVVASVHKISIFELLNDDKVVQIRPVLQPVIMSLHATYHIKQSAPVPNSLKKSEKQWALLYTQRATSSTPWLIHFFHSLAPPSTATSRRWASQFRTCCLITFILVTRERESTKWFISLWTYSKTIICRIGTVAFSLQRWSSFSFKWDGMSWILESKIDSMQSRAHRQYSQLEQTLTFRMKYLYRAQMGKRGSDGNWFLLPLVDCNSYSNQFTQTENNIFIYFESCNTDSW